MIESTKRFIESASISEDFYNFIQMVVFNYLNLNHIKNFYSANYEWSLDDKLELVSDFILDRLILESSRRGLFQNIDTEAHIFSTIEFYLRQYVGSRLKKNDPEFKEFNEQLNRTLNYNRAIFQGISSDENCEVQYTHRLRWRLHPDIDPKEIDTENPLLNKACEILHRRGELSYSLLANAIKNEIPLNKKYREISIDNHDSKVMEDLVSKSALSEENEIPAKNNILLNKFIFTLTDREFNILAFRLMNEKSSQEKIGSRIGISKSSVSKIIKESIHFKLKSFKRQNKLLDSDLKDLLLQFRLKISNSEDGVKYVL